jgi:hypothetical protein
VAFKAPDDATVDAFHRAAIAAGYRDDGAPGIRAIYHAGYYAAFGLDPDGNNVELVHHNDRGQAEPLRAQQGGSLDLSSLDARAS